MHEHRQHAGVYRHPKIKVTKIARVSGIVQAKIDGSDSFFHRCLQGKQTTGRSDQFTSFDKARANYSAFRKTMLARFLISVFVLSQFFRKALHCLDTI